MKRQSRRIAIGIIGGLVVVIGIILIPYPGPGWVVVFAGLGILSTEFDWAKRVLDYAKDKYEYWQKWLKRQNPGIQLLVGLITLTITVLTLWLLNGYGVINDWLHLHQNWLDSPLPFFK